VYEPKYAEVCSVASDLTDIKPGGYLYNKATLEGTEASNASVLKDTSFSNSQEIADSSTNLQQTSLLQDEMYGMDRLKRAFQEKILPHFLDHSLDALVPPITTRLVASVIKCARLLAVPHVHLRLCGPACVGKRLSAVISARALGYKTTEYLAGFELRLFDKRRGVAEPCSGFIQVLRQSLYYCIGADEECAVLSSLEPRKLALIISDPQWLTKKDATTLRNLLVSGDLCEIFSELELLQIAEVWSGENTHEKELESLPTSPEHRSPESSFANEGERSGDESPAPTPKKLSRTSRFGTHFATIHHPIDGSSNIFSSFRLGRCTTSAEQQRYGARLLL